MNICVTGGAGFIASHIADSFIERGHRVAVIDNLSMGKRENVPADAAFYEMDIRDGRIDEVFGDEKFDVLCHHAAQMDVRLSVEKPTFDAEVNVLGTLNLLQACVGHGVKKVIFASTGGAVYGEQETFPCNETHPTRPLCPYGITKLAVEKYLYYYHNEFGLNHVVLRYANIYGPRQNPKGEAGVVAIFADKLLNGDQPVINGDGTQTRDYTYVGDVVRANLLALEHEKNDIFNIGTGVETDVNTLFHALNDLTGGKAEERHGPAMPGEQKRSVIDHRKAEQRLGWSPRVSLDEGFRRTIEFFRVRA